MRTRVEPAQPSLGAGLYRGWYRSGDYSGDDAIIRGHAVRGILAGLLLYRFRIAESVRDLWIETLPGQPMDRSQAVRRRGMAQFLRVQ